MTETSMIADSAARIFAAKNPPLGGAMDAVMWSNAVGAGLHRLLLPEEEGGAGDAFEDAVAVAMAAGAQAAPVPLLETMAANWCLSNAGLEIDDSPKTLLFADFIGAQVTGENKLSWSRPFIIPWPEKAKAVVIVQTPGGLSVGMLDRAPEGSDGSSMAGVDARIVAPSSQPVPFLPIAPLHRSTPSPLSVLALLKAAAMAGAMDTALEMTIDYANTRKQFGRPIGQFQAMQHMIAQLSGQAVAATACVQHAAREITGPHGLWAVAVAKGFTSEAAGIVAGFAHQVHGAIGFTEEFALRRFTRRLWAWREEAGNDTYWYGRLGAAGLKTGNAGLWPAITHGLAL